MKINNKKMQLVLIFCVVGVVCCDALVNDKMDWNERNCGVEAKPDLIHTNPWLVYLEYYSASGHREYIRCAATLIGSRHLITAAHCVKNTLYNSIVARLGEYDISTEKDCVGGVCADPVVRIKIVDIQIHGGFDGRNNDIAILVLEHEAPYTDFIRPICLPTGSLEDDLTFSAAGWGEVIATHLYSNVKKIIPLPYWSTENCQKAYKGNTLPNKIICAGGQEGIDTCRGDSGGPLTLHKDRVELWGVTSSGNKNCGTEGTPGIYTNVQEHLDWIKWTVSRTSPKKL